jgi:hypothetical protein
LAGKGYLPEEFHYTSPSTHPKNIRVKKYIRIWLSVTGLWCLVIQSAIAQTSIGIRSGMVLSTVTGRAEPQAVGAGPTFGVVSQHRFNRHLGINAEVLFNEKGYVSRGVENGNKFKEKNRSFYVDIPVSLRVYFGKKENRRGFLGFGPHLGIGLYEKYLRVEFLTFEKERFLFRQAFPEDTKQVEAGLDIDLGYIFSFVNHRELELNFRQYIGLTQTNEFDLLGKVRNIYLSVSIAYSFITGKRKEAE